MRKRHFTTALLAGACLVMALVTSNVPVSATFPGANGRLAFGMSTTGGNVEIFSVLPNGHNLRQLTELGGFNACPNYSPDGRSIAWCRRPLLSQRVSEIWAMKANGKDQHQVTHTGGFMTFPNYSPDGTRIAFVGNLPGDPKAAIFVIRTDGSGLVRLTDDSSNNLFPAWSPDGTKIAFLSDRTGLLQVWVMNSNGTNAIRLTSDPFAKQQLPDWSPDGRRIAFSSLDASGGPDIFVMNAGGSGRTQLASQGIGPRWSPDGTKIAFLRLSGRTVFIMKADGSDQHAVHPAAAQFVPSWQPLPMDGESD